MSTKIPSKNILLDNPLRFFNFLGHVIVVSFLNPLKDFHTPGNFQIGPQVIHNPMIPWRLGSIILKSVGHTIFSIVTDWISLGWKHLALAPMGPLIKPLGTFLF